MATGVQNGHAIDTALADGLGGGQKMLLFQLGDLQRCRRRTYMLKLKDSSSDTFRVHA